MFGEDYATAHTQQDPDFYILPENWDAFKVFAAMQTQWNRNVGMSGMVTFGLNYAVIDTVAAKVLDTEPDHKDLFARLQVMEHEALEIFNKR